ncbi:MAG TPA: hypothetical protein VF572_02770 [Candidatus Saccharimonadales bacterium]|jgi:hypothetical protein
MAKNPYPFRGPRTSLVSDREKRRALRGRLGSAFGIVRPVDDESQGEIDEVTMRLVEGDVIPDEMMLREDLSVTLVSQKVIARQLGRGVVTRFNLNQMGERIDNTEACHDRKLPQRVERGEVAVYNGRLLYTTVSSPEVEGEIFGVQSVLESLDVRGRSKQSDLPVPHVTLGEMSEGFFLRKYDEEEITEQLDAELPLFIGVNPWNVYPEGAIEL